LKNTVEPLDNLICEVWKGHSPLYDNAADAHIRTTQIYERRRFLHGGAHYNNIASPGLAAMYTLEGLIDGKIFVTFDKHSKIVLPMTKLYLNKYIV
jgi:hypothetical protein